MRCWKLLKVIFVRTNSNQMVFFARCCGHKICLHNWTFFAKTGMSPQENCRCNLSPQQCVLMCADRNANEILHCLIIISVASFTKRNTLNLLVFNLHSEPVTSLLSDFRLNTRAHWKNYFTGVISLTRIVLSFSVHKETVNAVLFSPGKSDINIRWVLM